MISDLFSCCGNLVNNYKGVPDDNITEIFEILKTHENDITNLRIQQGHTSGK
jgi:hypothetical protein